MKRLIQLIDLHIVYVGSLFSGLFLALYYSLFASAHNQAGSANSMAFYVTLSFFTHLSILLPRIIIRANDKSKIPGAAAPYLVVNILIAGLFGVTCGLLIFSALSLA